MKLQLAKAFADGEIRNLVGLPGIPHWVDPKKEAIDLYEEISSALPTHFLAEKAIMGKIDLEIRLKEYRLAITTSESFIRKYPKSVLAPQAFENIGLCQLKIVENEFLDPDILSLAELNYKKFSDLYPAHPRLESIKNNLLQMKEMFADNLLTSAHWYNRVDKADAAKFYFKKIQELYPDTKAAELAQGYLQKQTSK